MARSRLSRAFGGKPTTRRLYGRDATAELAAARIRAEQPPNADLPRIDSLDVARQEPGAMVNDGGEVFYPDNPEDAAYFAEHHGARALASGEPAAE